MKLFPFNVLYVAPTFISSSLDAGCDLHHYRGCATRRHPNDNWQDRDEEWGCESLEKEQTHTENLMQRKVRDLMDRCEVVKRFCKLGEDTSIV
ncbi:hypothetical protein NPIL_152761 [Nephila pilipes]|uniref:Uncharacterized protein n=1 Tax=Nephila pilipes TaxID=299642 RepID=A0A8X6SZZ1_NEPPI|nr:hypothetical protein NPIL_152761 [Nephila pilipes]